MSTRPSSPGPVEKTVLLQTSAELVQRETEFLWPDGEVPAYRAGLALSGGGVRAATVSLGVLQTLAKAGLLPRFHYMSTVSGSGYIGSALSWFWSSERVKQENGLLAVAQASCRTERFGVGEADFPFQDQIAPDAAEFAGGTDDLSEARPDMTAPLRKQAIANLAFLRNHGSYLTSGDGIGFAGLIVAALRTILLSLSVWVPLLIAFFLLIRYGEMIGRHQCEAADLSAVIECRPFHKWILYLASVLFSAFYFAVVLFSFLSRLKLDRTTPTAERRYLLVSMFAVTSVISSVGLWYSLSDIDQAQPAMGVQTVVLAFVSFSAFMLAAAELFSPTNQVYFLRRTFEKYSSIGLPLFVIGLYVGLLPWIAGSLIVEGNVAGFISKLGPLGAAGTLLSGIGTAVYGYYLKAKSVLPSVAGQIFAVLGAVLFLAGLILFSFTAANQLLLAKSEIIIAGVLSLAFISFLVGWLGSVNETGLHRFYRDRLMETFMPMNSAIQSGDARQSDVADNFSVAALVGNGVLNDRPYHIINNHVILTNEEDARVVLRGGDNFIVSPAFVGSSITGWVRTKDYIDRHGALTLATAMATSGAAANANAGYIGKGITRDRFVSAVMAILNIRLGLWVGNPRAVADIDTSANALAKPKRIKRRTATYFWPVLSSGIFGLGNHSKSTFLELSDGGHFENLGLYELVRRRLDLILVVDAEQDDAINLAALVSSYNRIKEDFNVEIKFTGSKGAEVLLGQVTDRYPSGVKYARSPYLVASIQYPPIDREPKGRVGTLIYIKSTMIPDLTFSTQGYRAANPSFPHQSTSDQFFDPDQFEAYRDFGKASSALMIKELKLDSNFTDRAAILSAYVAGANKSGSLASGHKLRRFRPGGAPSSKKNMRTKNY